VAVSFADGTRFTRTDSLGRFSFSTAPRDSFDLSLRRLGYLPRQARFAALMTCDTLRVVLASEAASLPEVDVSAHNENRYLTSFEERRARGVGVFITRSQIDSQRPSAASDLFRNVSGVRLFPTTWGYGVRVETNVNIMSGPRLCMPVLWLDGQKAMAMEIDEIRPVDIEAMEFYRGPSTTPAQYASMGVAPCGTILVWTRHKHL
jgi:hypothetical protein